MKIFSPVKDYTGVSASVPFCNGVGETDDPHLIGWFRDHGYEVDEKPVLEKTVDISTLEDCEEVRTDDLPKEPKTRSTRK